MIKTIPHIMLSLMFFVLTVGISINKHYSNGELYSQSFFGEAEVCGMDDNEACEMQDMSKTCKTHKVISDETKTQSSCSCEDKSEYLHFDVDYVISEKLKINNIKESQVVLLASIIFFNYSIISEDKVQYVDTSTSVLKTQDFPSFFQVFLC